MQFICLFYDCLFELHTFVVVGALQKIFMEKVSVILSRYRSILKYSVEFFSDVLVAFLYFDICH